MLTIICIWLGGRESASEPQARDAFLLQVLVVFKLGKEMSGDSSSESFSRLQLTNPVMSH